MPRRDELRQTLHDITGYPERGQSGIDRMDRVLNWALKQVWRELPDALLREEWRFQLEPVIDNLVADVDSNDPLALVVTLASTPTGGFAVDGTLRSRWVEVTDSTTSRWYYRVRDVYNNGQLWVIILDRPWRNTTDTGLGVRIFTEQYPYPGDTMAIDRLMYSPENNPSQVMRSQFKEELDTTKWANGWRNSGHPSEYARGDFYQLPAPHYTPTLATAPQEIGGGLDWGYDPDTGLEHGSGNSNLPYFGAGGTFSYKVMHVWGRRRFSRNTQEGVLLPFYQSNPSAASAQITTTWGQPATRITTPDIDHVYGYGPNDTLPSYHHHGMEKWIFRARHATESPTSGTNNAEHKQIESDAVYYLWNIVEGHVTEVDDHGQFDPVDRRITLKDVYGHSHIKFDRLASTDAHILAFIRRRPDQLRHDSDSPRLPAECMDMYLDLACAYLVGRRDGEPNRESLYYRLYQEKISDLRRQLSTPGHDTGSFGDGLLTTDAAFQRWGGVGETT